MTCCAGISARSFADGGAGETVPSAEISHRSDIVLQLSYLHSDLRFLVAVLLPMYYCLFVVVSDDGFYACSTPYPSSVNFPASVSADDLARTATASNLIKGTNPSAVSLRRCDSVIVERGDEIRKGLCR
jgi:hypothetical protein